MNTRKAGRPRVSVIIPTYNCSAYLPDALDSVLAQSSPVDEIIVINDGSTDATAEAIAPYLGHIVYREQPNAGQATARNRGLDLASGEWVAFLDADDVWQTTKIERQLERATADPRVVCVHTGFQLFGHGVGPGSRLRSVATDRYDVESLLTRFLVLPSTVLVKGGLPVRFREWARTSEDSIYFAEVALYGRFAYVDEPLVRYRKHQTSVTARRSAAADSLADRLRWVDEQRQLAGAEKDRLKRLLMTKWDEYLAPLVGTTVETDLQMA